MRAFGNGALLAVHYFPAHAPKRSPGRASMMCAPPSVEPGRDTPVEKLAALFRENPAWRAAARRLADDASSAVYFSQRPGEVWHLARRGEAAELLSGPAQDPDLAFRFTPAAVERLAEVRGGAGDFAVALFELMAEEDASLQLGFRVIAPFRRLLRRGYVALLLTAGPKVVAFAAAHGVRTLGQVRRLVRESRAGGPAPWEKP